MIRKEMCGPTLQENFRSPILQQHCRQQNLSVDDLMKTRSMKHWARSGSVEGWKRSHQGSLWMYRTISKECKALYRLWRQTTMEWRSGSYLQHLIRMKKNTWRTFWRRFQRLKPFIQWGIHKRRIDEAEFQDAFRKMIDRNQETTVCFIVGSFYLAGMAKEFINQEEENVRL